MQKILIIHAHPESQSFCSSLKNEAVAYFRSQGAEVKVSDLYAMGFNPVGDKHDFTQLQHPDFFKYQMEQVHAHQNNLFMPDVKTEMDKLEWCDTLIFNHIRQQGVGNIITLGYLGAKIYLNKKSPVFEFYKNVSRNS